MKISKYLGILIFILIALQSDNRMVEEDPEVSYKKQQKDCLVEALWYEIRKGSREGIVLVASVISNRVNHKNYPDSWCKVIHQPMQFSYRNHLKPGQKIGLLPKVIEWKKYLLIESIAEEFVAGRTKSALHPDVLWYAATFVKPKWSKKMQPVKIKDGHIFYRMKVQPKRSNDEKSGNSAKSRKSKHSA